MRYFIANVLPHHLSNKYKLSVAAANFSWSLIKSDAFDQTFSIAPSNVYGSISDVTMPELVYSPLRNKFTFLSKFALLHENWVIFKSIQRNSSVWFYNISILNIVLFWLLRWFKPSVKRNVIILDIDIPTRRFSLANFMLFTMNVADATIRLSNSKRFTCTKSKCLPGVVPSDVAEFPKIDNIQPCFLLSGLLREDISQLSLLIDVFKEIPHAQLYITGFLEDDTYVRDICSAVTNIHYLGEQSYESYLELLHRIPFLLSTRNPAIEGNQCNFPSKVIEGLLHNRIIVSTIEYKQLDGFNYFIVRSEKKQMIDDLLRILKYSNAELLKYANQSDRVKSEFNPSQWRKIMEYLE